MRTWRGELKRGDIDLGLVWFSWREVRPQRAERREQIVDRWR
jgi:hypothetical protein